MQLHRQHSQCGSTSLRVVLGVGGLSIFLVRNVFFSYSLRSDMYTILNAIGGMRLCIGSLTSSSRVSSKVGSNDPSVSIMRYREQGLYRRYR